MDGPGSERGTWVTSPAPPSLEALGRALINLPHPVIVHRMGIILWANNAAAEIAGAPNADALVGVDSLGFVAPEQREFARERQVALLRDGVLPGSSVLRLLRFDGSEVVGEAKAALMDWEGEPAACMVLWDISARYEIERQLAWEATHDTLTSLANRRGVLDQLADWPEAPVADGSGVGVIIADLDGFKDVNDTLGHDCGDRVLVEIADRLSHLAGRHLVGRFGGDEFIVCVHGSLAEVTGLAEAVAGVTVALRAADGGGELAVAPSVGAAWRQGPTDDWNADALIIAADHAMYRAKRDHLGWVVDDLSAAGGEVRSDPPAEVVEGTRPTAPARRHTVVQP